MKLINWIKCKFGFHNRKIEDMGGMIFECCSKCNWVGRTKDYL